MDDPVRLSRRNVTVGGRRTSLRLETEIWDALGEICGREGLTLNQLCTFLEEQRRGSNRSSALRAFVVDYFRRIANNPPAAEAGGMAKEFSTAAD